MTIALNQPKAVSVPGGLSAIDLLVQDHRKVRKLSTDRVSSFGFVIPHRTRRQRVFMPSSQPNHRISRRRSRY